MAEEEVMTEEPCEHEDTWFDRSICPEPCGSMHYVCSDCGEVTDCLIEESA